MEFSGLGKHCTYCKQLDFLPFLCNKCNNHYCLKHRKYESHGCPNEDDNKNIKINKKIKYVKCCVCRKKSFDNIECKYCQKTTCLDHRFYDDHECTKLKNGKVGFFKKWFTK